MIGYKSEYPIVRNYVRVLRYIKKYRSKLMNLEETWQLNY